MMGSLLGHKIHSLQSALQYKFSCPFKLRYQSSNRFQMKPLQLNVKM